MAVDVSEMVTRMVGAAECELAGKWPRAKDHAEAEFRKLSEAIIQIGTQRAQGRISAEKAKFHLEMQKNSARVVLLALEGLSVLEVEGALNVALRAVGDTVNGAVGCMIA